MTLAAFARLLGTSPKWVLNTLSAVRAAPRYTLDLARRLTITRAIHDSAHVPLPLAFSLARHALHAPSGDATTVTLRVHDDDDVAVTIDVYRLLSSFNVRLAELRASYAPPVRGRPRTRTVDPLTTAADWGLDLSLIRDNLRKTPYHRLQQLDAMRAFAVGVRRSTTSAPHPDV